MPARSSTPRCWVNDGSAIPNGRANAVVDSTSTPPDQAQHAHTRRRRAWTHAAHHPTRASHQLTPPKPAPRLPTNCGSRAWQDGVIGDIAAS